MKLIPVKEEVNDWRKATIKDIPMLFTDYRIGRSTVPAGILVYDIHASNDAKNDFVTLEPCVMVNHTGTVLVKRRIPMSDSYLPIAEYGLEDDTTLDKWLNSRNEYQAYEMVRSQSLIYFRQTLYRAGGTRKGCCPHGYRAVRADARQGHQYNLQRRRMPRLGVSDTSRYANYLD